MIAFKGVPSSWLMLARNSDVCRLASSSCWLFDGVYRDPSTPDGDAAVVITTDGEQLRVQMGWAASELTLSGPTAS
jgi:hypothetical protein